MTVVGNFVFTAGLRNPPGRVTLSLRLQIKYINHWFFCFLEEYIVVKKNVPSKFSYALLQILSCELQVMQPDVLPSVITGSTPLRMPRHVPRRGAPACLRDKPVGPRQRGVSRRSESW